jgi:hypothetical protein
MKTKAGLNDLLWLLAGAVLMLALTLGVLYLHPGQDPAAQLAFRARRVGLVEQMRRALALASEAQTSAAVASIDQDSQSFVDQARAQVAAVEGGRQELERLLRTGGTSTERDLLAQFSRAFAEFQQISKDLLDLAVQNTNLRALGLAFGPAADALQEMDAALSRIVAQSAAWAAGEAPRVIQLADDARIRALRIQTLLPPHIAEKSDEKMDELEALMAQEDAAIRKDLEGLATLLKTDGSSDLEIASSRYDQFREIRTRIIGLSRENTNVRSLALALSQKRKVMLTCQDALAALKQAIEQEPIAKAPVSPR